MFGAACQHEACGEQDLSAVWTSGHLLWLEFGCSVLGANHHLMIPSTDSLVVHRGACMGVSSILEIDHRNW